MYTNSAIDSQFLNTQLLLAMPSSLFLDRFSVRQGCLQSSTSQHTHVSFSFYPSLVREPSHVGLEFAVACALHERSCERQVIRTKPFSPQSVHFPPQPNSHFRLHPSQVPSCISPSDLPTVGRRYCFFSPVLMSSPSVVQFLAPRLDPVAVPSSHWGFPKGELLTVLWRIEFPHRWASLISFFFLPLRSSESIAFFLS